MKRTLPAAAALQSAPQTELSVEYGVSAPHVGQHKVISARRVPQVHCVCLAGVPTVLVVISVTQKPAEDAVLCVEDREVLMDDDLKLTRPFRPKRLSQRAQLQRIEIVRGGEASQPLTKQPARADRVCRIEAKVPLQLWDHVTLLSDLGPRPPEVEQLLQHARAAYEQGVCPQLQEEAPHAAPHPASAPEASPPRPSCLHHAQEQQPPQAHALPESQGSPRPATQAQQQLQPALSLSLSLSL
eukprot:CAMPEP_0206256054 /NCGR_PEP_ID=MMETSP0047_2-20121206/24563_1 /ASSEMBLY_ACC=CAM_ASM_000192 /TAXON_ID=195065 /ORGANISM="Chroomonas mesostigmatica_cf, Strain CCMP1168" /LENGTH=241 /DNA_ID=CAMNT_0053682469 /DNA_START=446 /DNA_END=1168 /DNA_ORIENTATION=+